MALPELTGLAPGDLDQLIARLAALRQAQREQRARSHPASDARHKPRSGRPPVFPFPDRVVATVLHLRLSLPDDTLAHLLGTSRTTIGRALAEIQDLLDQHEYRIEPVTAPPDLPARIPPYVPRATGNPENKVKKRVNYLQALSGIVGQRVNPKTIRAHPNGCLRQASGVRSRRRAQPRTATRPADRNLP